MRKKNVMITLLIAVILLIGALIFIPRQDVRFDGDRVSNADRFALRFEKMNTTDSEAMEFQAGDALRVSWQIDSGTVDCVIGMAGEEPVYQANGRTAGDRADFVVTIPKSGTYTISVSARNAKGWLEFGKTQPE